MTEAEVFASCLALSHCHFLDTPYEGNPFSDELNSGASNVCHYCTIDTLLSIIENQCLRFTDVRFLNDSTEFLEVIPMIEHVLTNGNYSSSFKQFFLQSSIIEDLKSYRQSYSAISNVDQTYKDMPYRTYTCSLSKNCDSLNMWNYYAASSAGVNIGFDFAWNMFEGSNSYKTNTGKRLSGDIWLSRGLVIYNNFDKEKCVIKFLDHLFNVYSNLLQLNLLDKYRALLVQAFKEPINNMRCFFKNSHFDGEQEYRIVLKIPEETLRSPKSNPNIVNVSFFRRGKVLVPYVDYKFKKSSISQIVMNPYNCEDSSMMELGIQELLTMNGLDNVKNYHSNIPLRKYD